MQGRGRKPVLEPLYGHKESKDPNIATCMSNTQTAMPVPGVDTSYTSLHPSLSNPSNGAGKKNGVGHCKPGVVTPNGSRVTPHSDKPDKKFDFDEPHPLDLDNILAEPRRPPPKHERRKHRTSISFSDQMGSLEEANSLSAQLRNLNGCEEPSSPKAGSRFGLHAFTRITGGTRKTKSLSSLDLINLLEAGEAHECLSDGVTTTPKLDNEEDGWCHALFEVDPEKTMFRLFTYDEHKFLLSAKRVKEDFYISQYIDFPEEHKTNQTENADRFCGVVSKNGNTYHVWNRGCEICDNELAKYRCGLEDARDKRQEMATVRHCESKIIERDRFIADARQILVDIPTLDAEDLRQGWCQRFPRKPQTTFSLASMLPDWNPRIQSLSMKFLHSKVKAASSKNFLVTKLNAMHEDNACFQFGKTKSGLFNLSYRSPVAAIQAFGVALTLYNWLGASNKKKQTT